MVHTYNVTGMTCSKCEQKIRTSLFTLAPITGVEISANRDTVTLTMDKHVALADLQRAIGDQYRISAIHHHESVEQAKSWLKTYKPILLVFAFITGVTLLIQLRNGEFELMLWMRHFMSGFFLVFSFFKILDLKGFAESFVMYDVLAKRIPQWAIMYAFIELALGIAFLVNFNPFVTNLATAGVMTLSLAGVLQSVLNKRKIRCACLGAVFNLPMSTVTIIEDALMIAMSIAMLFMIS